jgi:hypothetical protein
MSSFDRARLLHSSNFGRCDGWYIELDGNLVGELSDARFEDMFWYSYAVEEIVTAGRSPIFDDDLWNACRFKFRNRHTGEVVEHAFCGGSPPFVRDGRVLMRALYLEPNTAAERLWLRILSLVLKRRRRL